MLHNTSNFVLSMTEDHAIVLGSLLNCVVAEGKYSQQIVDLKSALEGYQIMDRAEPVNAVATDEGIAIYIDADNDEDI